MTIRRFVKHTDTESEIMEFNLTDEEIETAYNAFKEKADKEWMRKMFRDHFADSWEEFTPEMEEAAYTQYLDEVSDAEWEIMSAAIFDTLGKYGKERED